MIAAYLSPWSAVPDGEFGTLNRADVFVALDGLPRVGATAVVADDDPATRQPINPLCLVTVDAPAETHVALASLPGVVALPDFGPDRASKAIDLSVLSKLIAALNGKLAVNVAEATDTGYLAKMIASAIKAGADANSFAALSQL